MVHQTRTEKSLSLDADGRKNRSTGQTIIDLTAEVIEVNRASNAEVGEVGGGEGGGGEGTNRIACTVWSAKGKH